MIIFHIVEKKNLEKNFKGNFYGDFLVKKDGFIHCCTFNQLTEVANNNFKNIDEDLIVLCLNTYYLKSAIKWIKTEKNDKVFPRVYGPVNGESIIKEIEFKRNESGDFLISDELFNYSGYEKSCGALIGHKFNNNYKFLIIGSKYRGREYWGFPKGHMEKDETEIETAKREIKEEVGIDVRIIPEYREHTYFSYKRGFILEAVYYAAVSDECSVRCQEGEVDNYLWCDVRDACDRLTSDCDKVILNKLKIFFDKTV